MGGGLDMRRDINEYTDKIDASGHEMSHVMSQKKLVGRYNG